MSNTKPDEFLDLRGVPCPANAAKALIKIGMMSEGETIEVLLDAGEPVENLPPAIEEEGHRILGSRAIDDRAWAFLIQVGA